MKVAKHSSVCSLERQVCLKGQNLNPSQLENDAQRFKEIAEKHYSRYFLVLLYKKKERMEEKRL